MLSHQMRKHFKSLCELSDESSHGTLTKSGIMLNLAFSTTEKNKTVLIPMTITVEVVHEAYMTHFLSVRSNSAVTDLNHSYLWYSNSCGGG